MVLLNNSLITTSVLDDDNFEPTVVSSSVTTANKWEGEDEDENVKVDIKYSVIIRVNLREISVLAVFSRVNFTVNKI